MMKIFNGIGTGSQLLPRITVQKGAMIGAEAVVIKVIRPYSIAVGVPTKIVNTFDHDYPGQSLTEKEKSSIKENME